MSVLISIFENTGINWPLHMHCAKQLGWLEGNRAKAKVRSGWWECETMMWTLIDTSYMCMWGKGDMLDTNHCNS